MAIAVNKNTTQQPMSAVGRTGGQTIKFIPGARVYVKSTPDSTTAAPVQTYMTKSNGVTPAGGWTDLGHVLGPLKVVYTQKVKEVTTGIDNYLRAAYIDQKVGMAEFALAQLDDVTLETISGLSASVITAGSIVNYLLGQKDLNQMALLMVVQSKLDSKELQFYNPSVYMNFGFEDTGDAMALKCTAYLPFFTALGIGGALGETILSVTEFA